MSSNSGSRFFLGRNQKVFGPLSASEIEALEQSGQLASYSWIFKEGGGHWNPIDPPPPLPEGAAEASEATPQAAQVAQTAQTGRPAPALRLVRTPSVPQDTFRVVLFDHQNAISGWLSGASDAGCEIASDQNGPDPLFVVREAAFLSLHDTRSGKTIKLRVRVSAVSRKAGGWTYRAHWDAVPSLLSHSNRGQGHEVAA